MTGKTTQDQHIVDLLDSERPRWSRYSLLLAFLVMAFLCVALSWDQPPASRFGAGRALPGEINTLNEGPTLAISKDGTLLVTVGPGAGETEDLFLCEVNSPSCINLTRSPSIRETWPVFDAEGKRVVCYGIGEAGADVFLIDMLSQVMLPLTVRAGTSGLHEDYSVVPVLAPAFSPDGQWVAFPARKGQNGAIELFVARSDGQQVLRVTDLGHEIRDYTWLDSETLLVAVQWTDRTLHYWTAHLESGAFRLEQFK